MTRRYFDLSRIPRTPLIPAAYGASPAAPIPTSVDFRAAFGPVRDQQAEGSCTGFSLAGLYQGLRGVAGLPFVEASPAFLYYEERAKEGDPTQDAGAIPSDGLAIMQQVGIAPESADPYVAGQYAQAPSAEAIAAASAYRIASWQAVARLNNDVQDPRAGLMPLLQLLAAKVPVEAAVEVRGSFENAAGGHVPMPGPVAQDPVMGGHAIVLCGYEDAPAGQPTPPGMDGGGWVVFRNSWSATWGDGGYGTLPYSFIYNSFLTAGLWSAALPAAPAPVPADDTLILVSGRHVTDGRQINPGQTWAPLRPVVEAMGWQIAPARTTEGAAVLISPRARTSFLRRLFGC